MTAAARLCPRPRRPAAVPVRCLGAPHELVDQGGRDCGLQHPLSQRRRRPL